MSPLKENASRPFSFTACSVTDTTWFFACTCGGSGNETVWALHRAVINICVPMRRMVLVIIHHHHLELDCTQISKHRFECQYRDAAVLTPTLPPEDSSTAQNSPWLKFLRLIPLYRTYTRSGFWHPLCSYAM